MRADYEVRFTLAMTCIQKLKLHGKIFAAFKGERENWHALEFADAALWSGSFSILFAQSQIFAPLFEITLHNSPFYDKCPIDMAEVIDLPFL